MDSLALVHLSPKLYSYAKDVREFGEEYYNRGFFASPDYYKTVSALFKLFPQKKYHAIYDVLNNMNAPEEYLCPFSISIDEEEYLATNGLTSKGYITVNTGTNEEYSRKPSTRIWGHENWKNLISLLRQRLPRNIKIVRVGLPVNGENTEADIDLCGKTNVEQAKALLKHAIVHVDYEGGLVHLRHVLNGGVSVVLHGPTSVGRYGYPENIPVNTGKCLRTCEWTKRDWLTVCQNKEEPHICMQSISVQYVSECICNVIEEK
jgi:ADP-heptose:LPS heptosyltransferase